MPTPHSTPVAKLIAAMGVLLLLTWTPLQVQAVPDDPVSIAIEAQLFGAIELVGGSVRGAFVQFDLGTSVGTIRDFTLLSSEGPSRVIFVNISVAGLDFSRNLTVVSAGSTYELITPSGQLAIHDNPAGVVMVRTSQAGVTVSVDLAPGIAPSAGGLTPDEQLETLELIGPSFRGVLTASEGTLVRQGLHIEAELEANGHFFFRALPEVGVAGLENHEALLDAIQRSRVGAELSVVTDHGDALHDLVVYRSDLELRLLEARRNKIRVEAEGIGAQGTVLVLQFARATLPVAAPADLVVSIDGEAAAMAEGANGVLSAALSQVETPLAFVALGDRGGQVLLFLPHFSTYTIELGRAQGLPSSLDLASAVALGGAAAIVVGAALLLFVRHRKR